MKKFFLYLALLTLTSCSWPEIGYRYADWLIKKRIIKVVKFYSPQIKTLEGEIDQYMQWHQKVMIPRYEEELLRAKKLAQKELTSEVILEQMERSRQLFKETTLPLSKRVSPLLAELIEEQVERTNTLLLRKIDENKDRLEWDRQRLKEETLKKWQDNTIDWLGSLNDKQEEIIAQGIDSVLYSPKAAYARAIEGHKAFMNTFDEPQKNREAAFNRFFESRYKNDDFKKWREEASALISKIMSVATPKQREHLIKKIDYWLGVLRDIKAI